jgi:hypothetical protein
MVKVTWTFRKEDKPKMYTKKRRKGMDQEVGQEVDQEVHQDKRDSVEKDLKGIGNY